MATGIVVLLLVATGLTDSTPITTQVEILQQQVVTLNGVLGNVIKEFGNLRHRHEDLETKYKGLLVELTNLRQQQDKMQLIQGRDCVGPREKTFGYSKRQSWNGTMYKPTFSLQAHLKGKGPNTANAGTKGEKGDAGLPGPKGDAGLQGLKGDPGLQGTKGDSGLPGLKGDTGLPGSTGPKGNTGLPGPKGNTGHTGVKGDSGTQGQKGELGSKGEPGVNGVQQKIGFHVELRDDLGSLLDDEKIIMNDALVQVGTGYNKNSGIFTCPVAGMYVFSVTIVVGRGGMVEVELYRNGHGILSIYAANREWHGSGSNLALVELDVNDQVWVQIHDKYYDQGETLTNHFTSFSGFLLYTQ